jgi:P27 family predicted phage terminase small subunit
MRGRKPIPVEQRRLEGRDVSHRPLPEPLLVAGRPELQELADPPEHLTAAAQDFWRDIVVQLVKVGMIDRVDRPALELICTTWDEYTKADRVVREQGFFAAGPTGTIKEHPALKMRRLARAEFFKYAEQYGLTPMARTRLGLAELHARTLEQELGEKLDGRGGEGVIDGTAEEYTDDVGLPGA